MAEIRLHVRAPGIDPDSVLVWPAVDPFGGNAHIGGEDSVGAHPDRLGRHQYSERCVKLGGDQKRIGVAVTRQDLKSGTPTYHVLGLEPWVDDGWSGYDRTYHGVVKFPYTSIDSVELNCDDFSLRALTDIWATPGLSHNAKTDILFCAARDREIRGFVLSEGNKVQPSYQLVVESRVTSVRVVHQPKVFEDDPEINLQAPGLTGLDNITYGGLEDSPKIYVDARGAEGYVRAPWSSYSGVRVDQHYVWVFGSGGFACATHASLMRTLNEVNQQPRWMIHNPDQLLYTPTYHQHERRVNDRRPLRGLVDVSPCDDGTLVAALYTRTVKEVPGRVSSWPQNSKSVHYVFDDTNALYSAVHSVDLKRGDISVNWTKLGSGNLGSEDPHVLLVAVRRSDGDARGVGPGTWPGACNGACDTEIGCRRCRLLMISEMLVT